MSVCTIGTIRPSDVSIDDIDIFYNYTPNRQIINNTIYKLNTNEVLSYCYLPDDEQISGNENVLEGLYDLKLPASVFNKIGIYTIYLKPKTITTNISDCGVLSALPTTKGLILNVNDLPEKLKSNNALQGYKVEYINSDGTKLRNVVRYVVSANKVSPITVNSTNTNQATTRYYFNDDYECLWLR